MKIKIHTLKTVEKDFLAKQDNLHNANIDIFLSGQ